MEQSVYDQLGEAPLRQLTAAFYRTVATDEILRPLYPEHDLAGAEQRLAGFLIQVFGGPTTYSQERGHPRLRMRHAPFAIGRRERDAWLAAMVGAMDALEIPEPAYQQMLAYFERAATHMINAQDEQGGSPISMG